MIWNIVSLVVVGLLWGATNPLIKKSSTGVNKVKSDSKIGQFILELKFLCTNWQYVLFFLLNQSGSLLYFLTLQKTDLSLSVPIANSLSFIFTAITSRILGEQISSWKTYLGMFLICTGTSICALDKIYN